MRQSSGATSNAGLGSGPQLRGSVQAAPPVIVVPTNVNQPSSSSTPMPTYSNGLTLVRSSPVELESTVPYPGHNGGGTSMNGFSSAVIGSENAAPAKSPSLPPLGRSHSENLLVWKKPNRPVNFREWYIFHYCNESQVRLLDRLQHICYPARRLITGYFRIFSFTGEAEFYIVAIPMTMWLGLPHVCIQLSSTLCMGQYVTGTLKDAVCCPRPPCPPLELRGNRATHDHEYGFPSTHSSHSGVLSYFTYCAMLYLFPEHGFLCWVFAAFYFVTVCFSRIYLGMHWFGDLIGGWVVAFICILFHVAFVDVWETHLVTWKGVPWYVYLLSYCILHALAVFHATPHDPCPCYMDSMRFGGAFFGAVWGLWLTTDRYGTGVIRPPSEGTVMEVLFSWAFAKQLLVCVVVVVGLKELSSFLGAKLLRVGFTFLSGAYGGRFPRPLRKPYLAMARLVGCTTRGNARGSVRYYPYTANNSFAFMTGGGGGGGAGVGSALPSTGGGFANGESYSGGNGCVRAATPTPASASVAVGGEAMGSGVGSGKSGESVVCGGASQGEVPMVAPYPPPNTEMIEEPDGYLNSFQVWSLRTHVHWWLWDVHKRTLSYFVVGLAVTHFCPVILREYFEVGKVVTGSTLTPAVF